MQEGEEKVPDEVIEGATQITGFESEAEAEEGFTQAIMDSLDVKASEVEIISATWVQNAAAEPAATGTTGTRRRLSETATDVDYTDGYWQIEWKITIAEPTGADATESKSLQMDKIKQIAALIMDEDLFVATVTKKLVQQMPEKTFTVKADKSKPVVFGFQQKLASEMPAAESKLSTAVIVVIALVCGSLFICGVMWGVYKFLWGKQASGPRTVAPPPQDA